MGRLDISLAPEEVDAFLAGQRTMRVATVGPGGDPQVIPLWFVWLDGVLFMNSTRGNASVENLKANPTAAAVADDGETYEDLRGVVVRGPVVEADDDPRLDEVASRWSSKYLGGNPVPFGRWKGRVWLRLEPVAVSSWDFRKIPAARARNQGATA